MKIIGSEIMDKESKKNYHLLTASTSFYSDNNFKELIEEQKKYGGVYWHISMKKGIHKIKEDDVCYIYYSNLPDGSSRIVLVGEVLESDYSDHGIREKSICDTSDKGYKFAEKGAKYAKLKINCVSLDDDKKFSLEKLRNKYNLLPKKGQIGYMHVDEKKHKELINDIEKAKAQHNYQFRSINKYFNDKYCICEFGHKTFLEENGFLYIETHHLVEQKLVKEYKGKKVGNIEDLIYDERNTFKLCPECHRKIHYICINERKEMIKTLYKKRKKFFDDNFNQLKNGKNTLEWLYDIYKCNK